MEQINTWFINYPILWLILGLIYLIGVNLTARALWLFEFEHILHQDIDLILVQDIKKQKRDTEGDNSEIFINLVALIFPLTIIIIFVVTFITVVVSAIWNTLTRTSKSKKDLKC